MDIIGKQIRFFAAAAAVCGARDSRMWHRKHFMGPQKKDLYQRAVRTIDTKMGCVYGHWHNLRSHIHTRDCTPLTCREHLPDLFTSQPD